MLRADDISEYTTAIRSHLDAQHGHLQRSYRNLYDKRAEDPRESLSSLWSVSAQHAMRETRKRKMEHLLLRARRAAAESVASGGQQL